MSSITVIQPTDVIANSRADINTNFGNLNTDKLEKGSGVTNNIALFGASNILADSGKTVPSGTIVGTSDSQTLTNKILTSPVINVGSDATGDIYYRNSGGAFTRLAIGGANTVLHGGTIPAYSSVVEGDFGFTDITTANASTSAHGLLPKLPNDATKFLNGVGAFAVPAGVIAKTGNTTHLMSSTTTTTIAHGLGKTPAFVRISVFESTSSTSIGLVAQSIGTYDGTTQNSNFIAVDSNGGSWLGGQDTTHAVHFGRSGSGTANSSFLVGTITVDATNITITWAATNLPTGTGNIIWEALG